MADEERIELHQLVVHLGIDDETKAIIAEDAAANDLVVSPDEMTDEETFSVVFLPGIPDMVTMREETLTAILRMIPGYRDHTIVPKS